VPGSPGPVCCSRYAPIMVCGNPFPLVRGLHSNPLRSRERADGEMCHQGPGERPRASRRGIRRLCRDGGCGGGSTTRDGGADLLPCCGAVPRQWAAGGLPEAAMV
jgi:hypothetical protein